MRGPSWSRTRASRSAHPPAGAGSWAGATFPDFRSGNRAPSLLLYSVLRGERNEISGTAIMCAGHSAANCQLQGHRAPQEEICIDGKLLFRTSSIPMPFLSSGLKFLPKKERRIQRAPCLWPGFARMSIVPTGSGWYWPVRTMPATQLVAGIPANVWVARV